MPAPRKSRSRARPKVSPAELIPLPPPSDDPVTDELRPDEDGGDTGAALIDALFDDEGTPGPAEADGGTPGLVVYDPLTAYLRKVRAIPELSREEEQTLARRYRESGNPDAARALIVGNLSLVVRIALTFRRAIANALDLIQEGNIGLIQAVEKFDPDVGVRFSTYAAWWIKAYILKYLLDNARMVRVGTTNARRKLIYNLRREKARLDALGFSTGPRMLAQHFGVPEQDVVAVEAALSGGDVPLDAPIAGEDDGRTRGSLIPSEDTAVDEQVARQELRQRLDAAIAAFEKGLGEREQAILRRRLVADDPETLQEIGDRFGITREAVRQSEERLLKRLRHHLKTELGDEVLLQFNR